MWPLEDEARDANEETHLQIRHELWLSAGKTVHQAGGQACWSGGGGGTKDPSEWGRSEAVM